MTFDEWFGEKVKSKLFDDTPETRYIAEVAYEAGKKSACSCEKYRWHYPGKGELPDDEDVVLDNALSMVVYNKGFWFDFKIGTVIPAPVAWMSKLDVPPEIKE